LAKFKKALDTHEFKAQIEADKAIAQKLGVRGTPNAFINGYNIRGAQPFSAFKAVIDRELAKARGEAPPTNTRLEGPNLSLFDAGSFPTPTAGTISVGTEKATTEVVLYMDLQDEFSGKVLDTLREMQKNNRRSLRLVVKHFPMGFHKEAARAAEAAESVAKRSPGKLWEFLAGVVANRQALNDEKLVEVARRVGADSDGVGKDLAANTFRSAVEADRKMGRDRGARATPTIFVNGKRYTGMKGYSGDTLKTVIQASRRAGKTP
jgi:protein-disulfide isomerase